MTIKELRLKDVARLAARLNPNPTPDQIEEATKTMRMFYRFAAAYMRESMLYQESRTPEAIKEEATRKCKAAYKRAAAALEKYNLVIDIPGLYPIIDEKSGANWTMGHWYN